MEFYGVHGTESSDCKLIFVVQSIIFRDKIESSFKPLSMWCVIVVCRTNVQVELLLKRKMIDNLKQGAVNGAIEKTMNMLQEKVGLTK